MVVTTDDARSWLVESLKGTSLVVIIMAVASVVWVVADISGQLRSVVAKINAIEAQNIGSRMTALELKAIQSEREAERLGKSLEKSIEKLGTRIDRVNSSR